MHLNQTKVCIPNATYLQYVHLYLYYFRNDQIQVTEEEENGVKFEFKLFLKTDQ